MEGKLRVPWGTHHASSAVQTCSGPSYTHLVGCRPHAELGLQPTTPPAPLSPTTPPTRARQGQPSGRTRLAAFGDVFSVIGVREPQPAASEAFVKFADAHRSIEKFGIRLLKTIKPMLTDLNTYLHKAIPDTRLTIKKYLDVKFEYLSYCLKVKEMDDEEYSCIALGEPLYRVSTGNYEYRLILRCRQEARARFSQMRKDVLEKMELLDQKHVQDIVFQLQRFVSTMSKYYNDCYAVLRDADVFPIEVDLAHTTLAYGLSQDEFTDGEEEEEDEEETAAREARGAAGPLDKAGSWCAS
ncbi:protein interacting with PRKCA 1 [Phyllostomus discolor]|uniref:Protein interacting with PRKCA 1 n=1 Tax=Phyllostomus discolor TaxID=89673 RepID=A0A834EL90_9CHIR|nr:protein interacting with PRKCA 1 [Phyllostomus discolor]